MIEQRFTTQAWVVAMLCLALSGVVTMAAIIGIMGLWSGQGADVLLPAAGCGAALSALVTARLFGRPGWKGWPIALVGGVLATTIGAVFGGLVWSATLSWTDPALDWSQIPLGGFSAPIVVWAIIAQQWQVALVWGVSMAGVHLVIWRIRAATP